VALVGQIGGDRRGTPIAAITFRSMRTTHSFVMTAMIAASLAGPAAAQSPQERPESQSSDKPSFISRVRAKVERLEEKGFRPWVGTIVPGSGLGIGAELARERFGRSLFGASIDGKISVRDYRQAGVRVGYILHRRTSVELRPADASLHSQFNDGRRGNGFAAFVEHRHRSSPRLALYADDEAGVLTRSDYAVSGDTTDLVLQWQMRAKLGFSARAGVLGLDLSPGRDSRRPNAEDVFGINIADASLERARYMTMGIGAVYDSRNRLGPPETGLWLSGALWRYSSRASKQPSFTRLIFDARSYREIADRHVVAGRLLGSIDGGDAAPFYLLQSLGGGRTMRGYETYRLRGARLVTASAEYRWHAWKYLEIAPFIDAGRVDRAPLPGTPTGWEYAPGIGFRARTDTRVVARIDFARSREGARISFSLGSPF
jgi:hypothetical protein